MNRCTSQAEADCQAGLKLLDAIEAGKLAVHGDSIPPVGLRVKLLYRLGQAHQGQGRFAEASDALQVCGT